MSVVPSYNRHFLVTSVRTYRRLRVADESSYEAKITAPTLYMINMQCGSQRGQPGTPLAPHYFLRAIGSLARLLVIPTQTLFGISAK